MRLRKSCSPATAIRINVLVDAYVTSFLAASVGYLTVQSGLESQGVLHAVGMGIVIGTILSLPLARLGDVVGETTVLSGVQILQVAAYVVLGMVPGQIPVLGALVGIFMLGRFVSPLRGSLPPRFLQKDELVSFKVALRTSTLTVVLLGTGTVSCVLLLDISIRACVCVLGSIGYLICILATQELKKRQGVEVARRNSFSLSFSLGTDVWLSCLKVVISFAIVATGSVLVPYILASKGDTLSWLLLCSVFIEIAINYVIQKNSRFKKGGRASSSALLMSAVGLGVCGGIFLVASAGFLQSMIGFSLAMIVVFCLNHTARTFATIMAWQFQYEKGDDKDRSLVVAVFSMSSALGVGLANFLGAEIYEMIGV